MARKNLGDGEIQLADSPSDKAPFVSLGIQFPASPESAQVKLRLPTLLQNRIEIRVFS